MGQYGVAACIAARLLEEHEGMEPRLAWTKAVEHVTTSPTSDAAMGSLWLGRPGSSRVIAVEAGALVIGVTLGVWLAIRLGFLGAVIAVFIFAGLQAIAMRNASGRDRGRNERRAGADT